VFANQDDVKGANYKASLVPLVASENWLSACSLARSVNRGEKRNLSSE